jgi:biotin carboxylase
VIDARGCSEADIAEQLGDRGAQGVIAFTDAALPLAAALAQRLGLAFHTPTTALALSDKWEQRRTLAAAGVPVPAAMALRPSTFAQSEQSVQAHVAFPAVLKPRRGAGSRGVLFVGGPAQLRDALTQCRDEELILEEYIQDREPRTSKLGADIVSVEAIMERGRHRVAGLMGRFPFAPPFRETGSFLPCDLPVAEQNAVIELAQAAAEALGVEAGALHTEVKLGPDGPQIVEVNGRLSGGAEMFGRLGGPAVMTLAMRVALGLPIGSLTPVKGTSVTFVRWWLPPVQARRLVQIDGLAAVAALPGVSAVRANREPGDEVDFREGGAFGHVVVVEGTVRDHLALMDFLYESERLVHLAYSSG